MVARVNLHVSGQERMARLLKGQLEPVKGLATRPHGVKHLGGGDLVWSGPGVVPDPDNPGQTIPGPPRGYSVKDWPKSVGELEARLEAARATIAEAEAELAAMQGDLDGIRIDVSGASEDATAAQEAATAAQQAAGEAQTAADTAAQEAATAAGVAADKASIRFQPGAPDAALQLPSTLWIDTDDGNTPKRWNGTAWVAVTDAKAVQAAQDAAAAQTAAQQAAAAATAAQEAAAAAAQDASDAVASANGKNAMIVSLAAPTPQNTTHPRTGAALTEGDWWIQWDNEDDMNRIGSWVWREGEWQAELLGDAVLGGMDVNKLLVLGQARINEAVVSKIMGDAAFFNLLTVEDLIVTDGATIDQAVIGKLAVNIVDSGQFTTPIDPETNLFAVMDWNGFQIIELVGGEEGERVRAQLGPDGLNNMLAIGAATIDNAGNMTAPQGTFDSLMVGGRVIDPGQDSLKGTVVGYGMMVGGASRQLRARDIVLGVEATLQAGRVYRIDVSSAIVGTQSANVVPFLKLHYTTDGSYPGDNWDASAKAESIIGPYGGFRSSTPMTQYIDRRNAENAVFFRGAVSLGDYANVGWAQVQAYVSPLFVQVTDIGTDFPNTGRPFFIGTGSTPPPAKTRRQLVRHATGFVVYFRGGGRDMSDYGLEPSQGQAVGGSVNREVFFFFDDMTAELAGATIHGIRLETHATRFWSNLGGTVRWHWHGHYGPPPPGGQQYQTWMQDTPNWKPGSTRYITRPSSSFGSWQNGTTRGFGFSTSSTAAEYFVKFSKDLTRTRILIDYEK